MRNLKIGLIILTTALFIVTCAKSEVKNITNVNAPFKINPTDELVSARQIYSQKCVRCHKQSGEGGEIKFDNVTLKVADLKSERVVAEPDDEYIKKIEKGGEGMPAYKGKITDEDTVNLVKYIRREFQNK